MVHGSLFQVQESPQGQGVSLLSADALRWILFEDGKEKRTKEGEKPDLLSSITKPEFDLTIVVPAYNEEKRLPTMMNDTIQVRLH